MENLPPWPIIEVAVEPKTKADQEKLGVALQKLTADPSFTVYTDQESGQTILGGIDLLQLDRAVGRLLEEFGIEINIGAPQIAYREMLGRSVEVDAVHKKPAGPKGDFARVKLLFEPGELGSGFQFQDRTADGVVPKEYIPGVIAGLEAARDKGLVAGFPVIDFKATLIDGAYHDVDSSMNAFQAAAARAFRELREMSQPKLLEPIMKVEVLTPDEYLGDVIGDLNSRRGQIQGADRRGDAQVVTALVPLANIFGYMGNLRGMSEGRAQFTMRYDHYAPVDPPTGDDDPDLFPPAMGMRA